MMRYRLLIVWTLATLFASFPGVSREASAYSLCPQEENGRIKHWKRSNFPLRLAVHKDGCPGVQDADLLQVIQNIFQGWNAINCTYARLAGGEKSPSDTAPVVDGIHMIRFISQGPEWQSAWGEASLLVPILTTNTRTGEIRDADLMLNRWKFTFSTNPTGQEYDLQSVLNHGIGRLLGLCASADTSATMYGQINPTETGKRNLTADDQKGICDLYPKDAPCKEGEIVGTDSVCFNGRVSPICPSYSPVCKPCRSAADCLGSQNFCLTVIDNGRCGSDCGVSGACPKGFQCVTVNDDNGNVVGKNCAPDTGTCTNAPALPCCRTNDDCLPGFSCILQQCKKGSTSDPCGGKCTGNEECNNGTCTPKGCQNDAQCGVGWKCVNSRCAPSGGCVGGCPQGQQCQSGKCVAVGGTACANDGDCGNGLKCALGGGIRFCTAQCVTARDCADGFFCVTNLSGVTNNGCWPATRAKCDSSGACTAVSAGGGCRCTAGDGPPMFEGLFLLLLLLWRIRLYQQGRSLA